MRPPSATASSRAIASPSPVPPPSRDQNGRKIRSRSSSLMPGPAVRDGDRDRRRSRPTASSSTRPPSGVQRNAFESRFEMIWSTRSPSVTITGCACDRRGDSRSRGVRASSPNAAYARSRELLHVDLFLQHGEAVRIELREIEHVADEALEPHRLLADHVERLPRASRDRRSRPRGAPRRGRGSRSAASAARATPT